MKLFMNTARDQQTLTVLDTLTVQRNTLENKTALNFPAWYTIV